MVQETPQPADAGVFDRFFNLSSAPICIAGFDGYFKRANPAFVRALGYTVAELAGLPLLDLVHPDDRLECFNKIRGFFRERGTAELEIRCRQKNGSYRWLSWSLQPDPDEEVAYALGRDITKRKQVEEERNRIFVEMEAQKRMYEALLDASPDCIFRLDPQSRFTYVNRASAEVIVAATASGKPPITPADILGHTARELGMPGDLVDKFEANHALALAGETVVAELSLSGTPETRTVECILSPVYDTDGNVEAIAGIARNVQDRKRADEERARLLQAEHEATSEAESAVRARDEFLSIASHELRNPVTSIKASAQMMRRAFEAGKLDAERGERYTRTLLEMSDRLVVLIDDLLDVSRLRTGRFPIHKELTALVELVQDAVTRQRASSGRHRLRVDIPEGDCFLYIDPDRIRQVLINLLDNAIKYSPEESEIRIVLSRDRDGMLLKVIDRGIGLPHESTEVIFQPFGRAANAIERRVPGMGLGLYICRRIAESHGGRLWAESEGEDTGTTMCLWLPVSENSNTE